MKIYCQVHAYIKKNMQILLKIIAWTVLRVKTNLPFKTQGFPSANPSSTLSFET